MSAPSTIPPTALVEPFDFPDTGRGLRCVRDVAKGEELIVVPLDSCWHAADSRLAPELQPLLEAGIELRDFDTGALHLLIERAKGPASARWAHLQEIPESYDATLFWSQSELDELKGSPWHGLALRFSEEASDDWEALQTLVRGAAGSTATDDFLTQHGIGRDDYLWAYATLKSRAAEAQVDGKQVRLMAPGFDLFNHSDNVIPGTSHHFDAERRALVAVAHKNYAKGEQAHISYGTASNGSLLLAGGFVLRHNRYDYVEVRHAPFTLLSHHRLSYAPTFPHRLLRLASLPAACCLLPAACCLPPAACRLPPACWLRIPRSSLASLMPGPHTQLLIPSPSRLFTTHTRPRHPPLHLLRSASPRKSMRRGSSPS